MMSQFGQLSKTEITAEQYAFFSKKIYELAGVNLPFNEKNKALLVNRLSKLMRKYAFADFDQVIQKFKSVDPAFVNEYISCLTTNKTDFFREKSHFDFLKQKLKTHFNHHQNLRIWCAAASTGQEPYTLAMTVAECLTPQQLLQAKILATDIDLEALERGATGIYSKNELVGIPPDLEAKYFIKNDISYEASPKLHQLISFCPFNLVKGPYQFREPFHFVFCRNVLIYFDEATIQFVINGLLSATISGGFLMLGHSETGLMKSPLADTLPGATFVKK